MVAGVGCGRLWGLEGLSGGLGRAQATLDEVGRARELAPRLSELFKRDTSGESRGAKISAAVAAGTPLAEAREMSKAELDEAAKEGYAKKGALQPSVAPRHPSPSPSPLALVLALVRRDGSRSHCSRLPSPALACPRLP